MDVPSGRHSEGGAAKRRRLRRLRSWWRHEQQTVAAVLATYQHHSAPRGQKTARTGGGAREELHGCAPEDALPQYFATDTGEDVGEAPAAGRPAPLLEVRPQEGLRRHTGVGFEVVLDPVVPQLGRELVKVPTVVSQPEFQQHSAEQNVDIPARGGVGLRGDRPARVLRSGGARPWRSRAGSSIQRGASL